MYEISPSKQRRSPPPFFIIDTYIYKLMKLVVQIGRTPVTEDEGSSPS